MNDLSSEKKNLIQLLDVSESEALKFISYGIRGEWNFYVMNSKENEFQILTTGQLQQIQSTHPNKAIVYLEEFQLYVTFKHSGNGAHRQTIGFRDLWVGGSNLEHEHDVSFSNQSEILMPEDEHYSTELDIANMAQRAVINQRNKDITFKQQTMNYLKTNFPNLRKGATERICTIINPDANRGGGRPKNN